MGGWEIPVMVNFCCMIAAKKTGATEVAVLVEARGIVQCFKDGGPSDCKDSGIDIPKFIEGDSGTIDGGTKAVIGKSTFVIEEQQNWNVY